MFNLDGDEDKDPECVLERLEKGDQLRRAWLLIRVMDIVRVFQKYYKYIIIIKINVMTKVMVAETIKLPSFAES